MALAAFVSRPGRVARAVGQRLDSVASVALAAAIGVPLAFLFAWLEFPGRRTLGSLIACPPCAPS